jgi:hypothetical protein
MVRPYLGMEADLAKAQAGIPWAGSRRPRRPRAPRRRFVAGATVVRAGKQLLRAAR